MNGLSWGPVVDFKHSGRVFCLFARVAASAYSDSITMLTYSWDNAYSQTTVAVAELGLGG